MRSAFGVSVAKCLACRNPVYSQLAFQTISQLELEALGQKLPRASPSEECGPRHTHAAKASNSDVELFSGHFRKRFCVLFDFNRLKEVNIIIRRGHYEYR